MSKHTPGPWKILKGHTGSTFFICYKTRPLDGGRYQRAQIAHVEKAGLRLVKNSIEEGDALASVEGGYVNFATNRDANLIEGEANARLIAAAPTLLKGLKLAVMEFERIAYQKKCDPEILSGLKLAIAKAEGLSQSD